MNSCSGFAPRCVYGPTAGRNEIGGERIAAECEESLELRQIQDGSERFGNGVGMLGLAGVFDCVRVSA
jgi:hypothetical protein